MIGGVVLTGSEYCRVRGNGDLGSLETVEYLENLSNCKLLKIPRTLDLGFPGFKIPVCVEFAFISV
jgi:hypothetical protein